MASFITASAVKTLQLIHTCRDGLHLCLQKRAKGEGNIRKCKGGRWEGRCTAGCDPKTGKRIIKNVLGKIQAEVKKELAKVRQEHAGLDVSRRENHTAASWLRSWYEL